MFARRLNEAILAKKSPLVVGLDPDITKFPPGLKPAAGASKTEIAEAILAFNKSIIDQVADLVQQ